MSRILTKLKNREKSRGGALERAADAILTAAGNGRLTSKFERGRLHRERKVRNQRLDRYKKKTAETIRGQAERREKIAVGLELYQRTESRLIKREKS
jgi:hypothetical protein